MKISSLWCHSVKVDRIPAWSGVPEGFSWCRLRLVAKAKVWAPGFLGLWKGAKRRQGQEQHPVLVPSMGEKWLGVFSLRAGLWRERTTCGCCEDKWLTKGQSCRCAGSVKGLLRICEGHCFCLDAEDVCLHLWHKYGVIKETCVSPPCKKNHVSFYVHCESVTPQCCLALKAETSQPVQFCTWWAAWP